MKCNVKCVWWLPLQVKKTWGATLSTLQDMTVLDDCDVSQSFTHSPSSESVKSSVSDGYLNKPSLAKRRANQQETELFYFNVRGRGLEPSCSHVLVLPLVDKPRADFTSCSLIGRSSVSTWRAATSSPSCRPSTTP